ncbi:response regulator [Thermodesulfobacteriota bacterium]
MAKKILVVDDDELVLIAVEELLGSGNHEVTTAPGGKEALEAVGAGRFDLVMLDVIMPEMDGYTLCKEIRSREEYAEVPIIFLTAKSAEEDRKRGEEVGASLYLPKPISPQRLMELVEQALGE